jgi:hypothetical protein
VPDPLREADLVKLVRQRGDIANQLSDGALGNHEGRHPLEQALKLSASLGVENQGR